jgi:hypothetical protein
MHTTCSTLQNPNRGLAQKQRRKKIYVYTCTCIACIQKHSNFFGVHWFYPSVETANTEVTAGMEQQRPSLLKGHKCRAWTLKYVALHQKWWRPNIYGKFKSSSFFCWRNCVGTLLQLKLADICSACIYTFCIVLGRCLSLNQWKIFSWS